MNARQATIRHNSGEEGRYQQEHTDDPLQEPDRRNFVSVSSGSLGEYLLDETEFLSSGTDLQDVPGSIRYPGGMISFLKRWCCCDDSLLAC